MIFRIKIKTYVNGRQEFFAYVKKKFWFINLWYGIDLKGNLDTSYATTHNSRQDALELIDAYLTGNSTIKNITFEYIIK